MLFRNCSIGLAGIIVLLSPQILCAGMPTISLSQSAIERTSAISFFLVMILAATAIICFAWNGLRKDIPQLPAIGWRAAFGIAMLWGLLSIVVLTMISGARELMTPGAWKRDGLVYKLSSGETTSDETEAMKQWKAEQHQSRKDQLTRLQSSLLVYAIEHEGKYPDAENVSAIPNERWQLPKDIGGRYLYYPGKKLGESKSIIVIEPQITNRQFVLFADGIITELLPDQIELLMKE